MSDIEERIISVLEDMGMIIDLSQIQDKNNILIEYLQDSVSFIQFIVGIEEEFGIEFPDEYLNLDNGMDLSAFVGIIERESVSH